MQKLPGCIWRDNPEVQPLHLAARHFDMLCCTSRIWGSFTPCCCMLLLRLNQVLLLWEVLWAKAWQHKHGSKETTKAADQHAQLHSPASTNSSASGKTQIVTANSGSFQLSADSRSSSRSASRAQFHQQVQTPDLFTCFVAAVIINQRRHVLAHCHDADDVLRMFHGLQQVDVWRCLQLAEELQAGMVLHAAQER